LVAPLTIGRKNTSHPRRRALKIRRATHHDYGGESEPLSQGVSDALKKRKLFEWGDVLRGVVADADRGVEGIGVAARSQAMTNSSVSSYAKEAPSQDVMSFSKNLSSPLFERFLESSSRRQRRP